MLIVNWILIEIVIQVAIAEFTSHFLFEIIR